MGSQTSTEDAREEEQKERERSPLQIPRKDPRDNPNQIGYIQEVVSDNTRQFRRGSPFQEDDERRYYQHPYHKHHDRHPKENNRDNHPQNMSGYEYRPSDMEYREEQRGPYKVYTYYEPVIQYQKVLKRKPDKGINRANSIDRMSIGGPTEEEIEMERMIRKKRQEQNYNRTQHYNTSCKNYKSKRREHLLIENPECEEYERYNEPIYSKPKNFIPKGMKNRPMNDRREIHNQYPPHYYHNQPRESEETSFDFGIRDYYKPIQKPYSNYKGVVTKDPRMKISKKGHYYDLSQYSQEDYVKAGYPTHEEMIKREWIEPINIDHRKFEKRMNYNHY